MTSAKTDMSFPKLLSPIRIGPITLRHRAVMSGHGMALGNGEVGISDRFQAYLMARAKGGAAMVGSESAPVHASTSSRSLGIHLYSDEVIPSLRRSAEEIRAAGSRLAITLWHGGHKDSFIRGGVALAPSPVPNLAGEVPKQMTRREIRELITAYGQAARRCRDAGLDAIEVQTSTDYLLGSFLSPVLNRRTDDYGLDESVASMKALADAGLVDYVSVMTGSGWSPPESSSIAHMAQTRVQLREEGKAFKQAIKVPVVIAGRIRSAEEAEQVIAEGSADIVAMARTWIADPEWGTKVESGNAHRIRPCMSCNQACVGFVFRGIPGSCVINPVAGREHDIGDVGLSARPQTVAVIGGGPAGMEAARVLALRGHRVSIYEKQSSLGGDFRLAVQAPHRAEMKPALAWWQGELEHLQVRIFLNHNVTDAKNIEAETVIWATGATPGPTAVWRLRPYLFDGIPGTANLPHGRDVLAGRVQVSGAVLVIEEEGGWPTVSLVETLAADPKVTHVTVTTPERALGDTALTLTWEIKTLNVRLRQNKITVLTETLVKAVKDGGAILASEQKLGPFDAIILNTGTAADNFPDGVLAVGDCVAPRGIWAATSDAAKLARTI